jgi:superfamily I DNA/RNA helicase
LSTTIASTFHSFAYGLVRTHHDADPDLEPPRLLSAAQQDVRLRELLGHASGPGRRHPWPEGLRGALGTRGFGREVQAVIRRARELGLEPGGLMDLAERAGRADWLAAGSFMEEYLHVMDLDGAMDYTELIHRASVLVGRPDVRKALRSRYSWVLVDEYQDTDRGQQAIVQALAGDGRNLIAAGDPDQSIYAFRGAEVRGIMDFPEQFRTATGARATVVALRDARRFGASLVAASRRIAEAIPLSGAVDLPLLRGFRDLAPAPTGPGDGRVEARLFATPRAETDHIADILRRAHLEEGVDWSEMAVLVRSG